jgi:SAM-dependent methyltransferase
MGFIFDNALYRASRESRLRNLFRYLDSSSLPRQRILELGCGTGELGQAFVEAGCDVVSVDARAEYIEEVVRRFPGRPAHVIDLEHWDAKPFGRFDAVLCFGLLYHLSTPAPFLAACAGTAPHLYLETAVSDSSDAVCPLVPEEGPDQAWSGNGCRPSPAWLNRILSELGFEVRDISTRDANWGGLAPSVFDWAPLNDGQWLRDGAMLRKMLICTRSSEMKT